MHHSMEVKEGLPYTDLLISVSDLQPSGYFYSELKKEKKTQTNPEKNPRITEPVVLAYSSVQKH